ncbi:MAG TPA: nickel transporter, partial [Actinomycetota bacterium]|nr:nickel transporter [Actinomycetota bacterium]
MRGRLAVVLLASVAIVGVSAGVASAHPLGNFTTNVYSGLRVLPGQIRVDYVVDLAEIPALQAIQAMDADGDGEAGEDELRTWADARAREWEAGLSLQVDGEELDLQMLDARAGLEPGQGGLDIVRFEGSFAADAPDAGALTYEDANFEGQIGWREITAVGQDGAALSGSSVPADSVSDGLRSYPDDLLASPLDVRTATMSFEPGASLSSSGASTNEASGRPGAESGLFGTLLANEGVALMAAGVAAAIALGAWHALLPGHGKTLMAAYMVGSGARVRHAVSVGAAVSIMHTASVLALGLLVLTLERTFRPETLYPWLGLASGLVALGLGAYLLVARLSAWSGATRQSRGGREPGHHHGSDHDHASGHDHEHGSGGHSNALPEGTAPMSPRGLMALALAGGILPAPSALLVMLGAINAHRAAYGITLVLAFSIGLA